MLDFAVPPNFKSALYKGAGYYSDTFSLLTAGPRLRLLLVQRSNSGENFNQPYLEEAPSQ